jgi:hypothetical protein
MTRIAILRVLAVAALSLFISAAASAQIFEITHSIDPTGLSFEAGSAFDPVHDCYFIVSTGLPGPVTGLFLNRSGAVLGSVALAPGPARVARVAYSPDISDGAGGLGAFVAIWSSAEPVFGQAVAFPGRLVGPTVTISGAHGGVVSKAGIAYSPVHHVFLVGLGLVTNIDNFPSRLVRLNLNLQPLDDLPLSSDLTDACGNAEFIFACNEIGVAWNPISSEFGVLYNQDRQKILARVSGGGPILRRTPLGIGPLYGALAVNPTTGHYLVVGAATDGVTTDGAEVAADGSLVGRGFITSSLDTQISVAGVMGLAYSAASGTFLLVGNAALRLGGGSLLLELNPHGVPLGSTLRLPRFPSVLASHATAPEWMLAMEAGHNYSIGTLTRFGGSDARLGGCLTPDPFVVLGGGTCANGGWLPPGIPAPPPPVAGGCATPDPFVALGGGTCANGGWLPPGIAAPAPPPPLPPVVPGGCGTPDPFVALGGGTCVNGGWLPPGISAPPPPPVVPGGCITPDPFVAIGGGVCMNGGWTPRG